MSFLQSAESMNQSISELIDRLIDFDFNLEALPNEKVEEARRKICNKPPKETNLGAAQALLDT